MTGNLDEYDLAIRFGLRPEAEEDDAARPRPPAVIGPTPSDAFIRDLRACTLGLEVADLFTEAQDLNPFRNGCKMASKHIVPDWHYTPNNAGPFPFGDVPIERHTFAPVLGFRRPT